MSQFEYLQQSTGCMLIVPPYGPWEIYPRRRACNRLVSHSPAMYQRRWSTCSDGCSTSNKTVDRHPFLTLLFLFNSIQFWCVVVIVGKGSVFCVWEGQNRDGGAILPTVVVRRGFPFGLCSLPGTVFFLLFSGKFYVEINLDLLLLCLNVKL